MVESKVEPVKQVDGEKVSTPVPQQSTHSAATTTTDLDDADLDRADLDHVSDDLLIEDGDELQVAYMPPVDPVVHSTFTIEDQTVPTPTSLLTTTKPTRYCGNRFSKWEYQILILLCILNVIVAILIPLSYFVFIPSIIQSTLNDLGTNSASRVILRSFSLGNFSDSALKVGVNLGIPSPVPFLPVRAGLGETGIRVTDAEGHLIALTKCPALDFWVNGEIGVDVLVDVDFNDEAQENLRKLLSQLRDGVSDLQIVVNFKAPITFFGMTIYSGLDLNKRLDLGNLETSVESLVLLLDRIASSFSPASFSTTGNLLANMYSVPDVISFAQSFSAVWSNLSVELNDNGLSSVLNFSLENGSPFLVTNLPGADFLLELQGVPIARVIAHQLSLGHGLQDLVIKLDVLLLDEKLELDAMSKALERASLSYALTSDFVVSIVGPVVMPQASFIEKVTRDFRFDVPLSEIMALGIGSNLVISDLLNDAGVESILGNSTLGLLVDSKQIKASLGLALPNLFPIPRKFDFPYTSSIQVLGSRVSMMKVVVDPVSISRSSRAISVNTSLSLVPVNSNDAAVDLAGAVNPILALKPQPGLVGVGDLLFNDGSADFKWTRLLFGGKNISIHLPPLHKMQLVDSLLNFSSNMGISKTMSQIASLEQLKVAQLNDVAGFGVDGTVDVNYPSGAPKFEVDVGYFGVDATLHSSVVSSLVLPSGLSFHAASATSEVALKALAKLPAASSALTDNIQHVVDTFLEGSEFDDTLYAGVTGLLFGPSSSAYFVTFSKVILDISLGDLGGIANRLGVASFLPSAPSSTIAKIESADVDVQSSRLVSLAVGASVSNPYKVSLGLGNVGLTLELDKTALVDVQLSPFALASAQNTKQNMALALKAIVHSSQSGSAEKLGSAVSDYTNGITSSKMAIGVVGVSLQGTGANSKIDFLSSVRFNLAVGSLVRLLKRQDSTLSKLVDITALIPTTDQVLADTHPSIKFATVDTSIGQSRMQIGADLDYRNVVPVSFKVPFASVDVSLGSSSAFVAKVSGIDIERVSGIIRPRVELQVKRDDAVAGQVGSLVHNIANGQSLQNRILLSKIYFGTGPSDQNDLFSALSLDSTKVIEVLTRPISKLIRENSARITLDNGNGLSKRDLIPWTFSLFDFVSVKVDRLDLAFSGDRSLRTGVGASIGIPFPVEINIPYLSLNALVERSVAISPSFSLSAKGSNPILNLDVLSELRDSDDLADEVAKVIDVILNGGSSSQHFGLENLVLGASASDAISAFSQVNIGVPVDVISKPAHDQMMKLFGGSVSELLRSIDLNLGDVKIGAAPDRKFLLDTPITFKSGLLLSLTGLHYIGLSLGLDGTLLTNVELPRFDLKPGSNKFDLSVKAQFPSSGAIQDKVGGLAGDLQHHLGETSQRLQISGLLFGSNPAKPIKFLNRAVINLASSHLFTPETADYFYKMIIPSSSGISLANSVKLDGAAIEFSESEKIIKAGLIGSTKANISVSVALPYVSVSSKLNSVDSFGVTLDNLKLSGTGPFDLHSAVRVHDTDALADNVANLVEDIAAGRTLSSTFGVRQLNFGASSSDFVDTFSKVTLDFNLERLLRPILNSNYTISSVLELLNVSPSGLDVKTAPARSLDVFLQGKLDNGFSLSLKNLGFFGLSAGFDHFNAASFPPILSVFGSAANVNPGQNDFSLRTNVFFPSNSENQKRVAVFAQQLYNGGLGTTKENLTATGLLFGASKDASFKFLSKAALSVASSSFLTDGVKVSLLNLLGVGKGGRLFDLFSFSKLNVDGSSDTAHSVNFDLGMAIKNTGSLRSSIHFGHLDADIGLNDKLLLSSQLFSEGVSIVTGSQDAHAEFKGKAIFTNEESLQKDVGRMASAIWSGSSIPGRASLKGVQFGVDSSPENMIDIFSQIDLAATTDSVYKELSLPSLHVPTIYDVVPVAFDLDVHSQDTLLAHWEIKVAQGKIADSINITLPFLRLQTFLDDSYFMGLEFTSFTLQGSKIQGGVLVKFPLDDPRVNQELVGGVADILFHRAAGEKFLNSTVSFSGLSFGPSESGAVLALSQISGGTAVDPYYQEAGRYFDSHLPVEFNDIDAHLTVPGLEVNCLIKPLPFPITVKLNHLEIDIGWQVAGVGKVYEALHVRLDSVNLPAFHVSATPDLDPVNGGFEPLQDLLINLFSFKEFLGNARFKNLKLIGSNGAIFTPYQTTLFAAPPSFQIPDPGLYVELFPYQQPLIIALSVRNPTSLHLDLGRAVINLTDADTGEAMLSADTTRDVVALNINEGGNGTPSLPPTIALLTVPVFNIGGILLDLPKLIVRLLTRSKATTFAVDVHLYRNGADIGWVAIATQYLVTHGLIDKFTGILGTILAHLKISISENPPAPLPDTTTNSTMNGNSTRSANHTLPPPFQSILASQAASVTGGGSSSKSIMDLDPAVAAAVHEYWKGQIPRPLILKGH